MTREPAAASDDPRANPGANTYGYPLERTNDRSLPPDYSGPIDVFDIDKTYLESDFERLGGLLGAALERAVDKRTRPGTAPLLRALRRGPAPEDAAHARAPLYFVSASPPQLRRVLERKMTLDGVEWDGIAFKDHLALVRSGRLREVRRHVAFKLTALLEYRIEWPAGAREWLYGDDAESDPLIYSLYASILAGELAGGPLDLALARAGVAAQDRRRIAELAASALEHRVQGPAPGGSVASIVIFRARTSPRDLSAFPRVRPVANALECAKGLAAAGRIAAAALDEIARACARSPGEDGA